MKHYILILVLIFSLSFCELAEFERMLNILPDSSGMIILVDDYKSFRNNEFRRAVVNPIISGKPSGVADRTRQINKLSAKLEALEQAGGFRFIGENLEPLIGQKTALAFYYVGDVEFVYITTMPVMPPILKKPRSWYEKHPQGEITYWTAQRDRQGAWGGFFWYDGLLIISNSPKQIQRTIALINNESSALKSIGDDKLFFQVLDACEFTGEKEQAAVILNTELLRNDPYYNRYYQGVPSERQTFKRVAFSFKFQDNIAEIIRASYPDNPELEIENKTLGEFLDYTPKNAFLYNEFAVSKFYSVETMLPFGELFSLQENDNPSLISAGCSWFPLDYEDSDITLILPIIFLKMDNPTHWIEPAKVHIADMATDTILKDYTSVWKTDGKVNFLCDMLGTELGFAYRIDGSVVLISSCSDALLKSKLGSPKIIKEHLQESEGISCNVIIPDKMASNVSKHLRILSEWDMIQSYSAEQFLKDFILPIGKDVLTNIELIRQVECFDENRKMFITKMSVKLK